MCIFGVSLRGWLYLHTTNLHVAWVFHKSAFYHQGLHFVIHYSNPTSISAQCTFICYHLLNDFIAGWLHSFRPRCIRKVKKKCLAIHDSSGENILAVFGCMRVKNIMASVFYESSLQSLIPASVNARRKKIKCPHAVSSNVCSPN